MAPIDVSWMDTLLNEAEGLSDEDRNRLKGALTSDKVAKKAGEFVVPRAQYQSDLDRERSARSSAETQWGAEKQRYNDWYVEQKQKVDAFFAENGGNPHNATPVAGNPNVMRTEDGTYVPKAEIDKLKQEIEQRFDGQGRAFLGVLNETVSLTDDYRRRFNDSIPLEEIQKIALEEGMPLRAAYDRFIQPKVQAQQEEEWKKKLELAREEGRVEGATRAFNPASPALTDHPVFGRTEIPTAADGKPLSKDQIRQKGMEDFDKAWAETNGFAKR